MMCQRFKYTKAVHVLPLFTPFMSISGQVFTESADYLMMKIKLNYFITAQSPLIVQRSSINSTMF